jgi:hypothetical protein
LPLEPLGPETDGMTDRISKAEIRKDAVQDGLDAATATVGQVATIVTGAVRGVVRSVGELASELFEIREAARRAMHDAGQDVPRRDEAPPSADR